MLKKMSTLYYIILFVIITSQLLWATNGTIEGKVTDVQTGNPLIGADVIIENTSLGAATNLEGKYIISNLPPGVYYLKFTYIGFKEARDSVTITGSNQTVILNKELEPVAIKGKVVTVTAQAVGQLAAINQQISANGIVNIVDAQRIQELPDQNVAEAIARLPGITVTRENGESSGIGIRGLAPQYNLVEIDGVVMTPSAGLGAAGGFSQNRGVSLSNISQENLSGIEVYKSITPDMDAATLGGTVNMRLGTAPEKSIYEAQAFGAYNAYEKDLKQYKVFARISRRFFDSKFGMQLSVNAEQMNEGSDQLNGSILMQTPFINGIRVTQYKTESASIENIRAIRDKRNINAIFDYHAPGTELLFANFFNSGLLTSRDVSRDYSTLNGYKIDSKSYMIMNSLRGTHNLSNLKVEWQLSQFRTRTNTPDDYQITFTSSGANTSALNAANKITITPEDYINLLPTGGSWNFFDTYKTIGSISETKYAEKLDIQYPFFNNEISGFFKTGVLIQQEKRTSDLMERDLFDGRFPNGSEGPTFSMFTTNYDPDPILNSNVYMHTYLNVDNIQPIWTNWIKNYVYADYQPLKFMNNDNYDIQYNYYAGYFMMKIGAFNNLLTLIPGVRYEGDNFDADGYYQYLQNNSTITFHGIYKKTNAKRNEGFWLPMVNLKVKPLNWFDTRMSITKTISRPNYVYLIPYTMVSYDPTYVTQLGNPDLKTTTSLNYDLSFNFYDNKFGLFTIAGYYKEIRNFSYVLNYYVSNAQDAIKYGLNPDDPAFKAGSYFNKELETPVNTYGISTVKGFEVDYQANLFYLPGLLKNIVFSINYTRIFSKSWLRQYKVTLDSVAYISQPPYIINYNTYTVGYRPGPLPTQPNYILNVTVGYDIGGFSGRFSSFYQGRSLYGVGYVPQQDTYVNGYLRYDMSLRYRLNNHLSFLFTGTNLSSTPDITTLSGTSKHSTYDIYGAMYNLGVQYNY